jgi:hypothetical protein
MGMGLGMFHNNGSTKLDGLDCPAVAPKIKTSVLRVLLSASARGIKGDLNLEKIPESGELNNMLPRQNRAN